MGEFKAGVLVWYWDGSSQRTGVIVTWGRKFVTIMPTPASKVKLDKVMHVEVNESIPWGGGRKKLSFKGWKRLVKKCGGMYGYTKEARTAMKKLDAM